METNKPMEISVGEVKALAKAIAEIEIENGTYHPYMPAKPTEG